jgi:hypothetical protein
MKKIIGILGVAVIATAMFFSANAVSSTNDTDLSSLIAIDAANAEEGYAGSYFCKPGGTYCMTYTYQHYRYDRGLC